VQLGYPALPGIFLKFFVGVYEVLPRNMAPLCLLPFPPPPPPSVCKWVAIIMLKMTYENFQLCHFETKRVNVDELINTGETSKKEQCRQKRK
jgi:hypothetical protein